jgi:hypothetical protein
MSDKRSNLTIDVSVKDTELFHTVLGYMEGLIDILRGYDLSSEDRAKLNAISKDFFEIQTEEESE